MLLFLLLPVVVLGVTSAEAYSVTGVGAAVVLGAAIALLVGCVLWRAKSNDYQAMDDAGNVSKRSFTPLVVFGCVGLVAGLTLVITGGVLISQLAAIAPIGPARSAVECPDCPVDCVLSEWVVQTECDNVCGPGQGEQVRTRNVLTEPMNGGAECQGLWERNACPDRPACVECQVGPWVVSPCLGLCGQEKQYQRRAIIAEPTGSFVCPATEEVIGICPFVKPCPINCALSPTPIDGPCSSTTCGLIGTLTRTWTVIQQPAFGGAACPPLTETVRCKAGVNCVNSAVDCVLSDWFVTTGGIRGDVCPCGAGGEKQYNTRTVIQRALNGGLPCSTDVQRFIRLCPASPCPPVDCKLSDEFMITTNGVPGDNCRWPCGGEKQYWQRVVVVQPSGGGLPCPTSPQTFIRLCPKQLSCST